MQSELKKCSVSCVCEDENQMYLCHKQKDLVYITLNTLSLTVDDIVIGQIRVSCEQV